MSNNVNRKYGWKRGVHSVNDPVHYLLVSRTQHAIPKVDLRYLMPPVYDQDVLGSCTGNAIAAAYEYGLLKLKDNHPFTPSRLFIYWNERDREGTVSEDNGAVIATGLKVLNEIGVCPEHEVPEIDKKSVWPYDISKFAIRPPQSCFETAKKHKSLLYRRVPQTTSQLKQALIAGFPVVFGFVVHESFEKESVSRTGIVHMPGPSNSDPLIGGHAVLLCGYDDDKDLGDGVKGAWIVRNSWGSKWGDGGYFYMPYAYLINKNLADDFWTVTMLNDLE